jgi:hypothetical protein
VAPAAAPRHARPCRTRAAGAHERLQLIGPRHAADVLLRGQVGRGRLAQRRRGAIAVAAEAAAAAAAAQGGRLHERGNSPSCLAGASCRAPRRPACLEHGFGAVCRVVGAPQALPRQRQRREPARELLRRRLPQRAAARPRQRVGRWRAAAAPRGACGAGGAGVSGCTLGALHAHVRMGTRREAGTARWRASRAAARAWACHVHVCVRRACTRRAGRGEAPPASGWQPPRSAPPAGAACARAAAAAAAASSPCREHASHDFIRLHVAGLSAASARHTKKSTYRWPNAAALTHSAVLPGAACAAAAVAAAMAAAPRRLMALF